MKTIKTLTFEISSDGQELEIHGDREGLTELIEIIGRVLRTQQHDHLMTPEWGGTELTQEPQGVHNRLVNKVSVYVWDEKNAGDREEN